MTKSEVPVGIDLGTTFSAVAHLDAEGRPSTIVNSEGELTTPSVVFFDHDAVIIGTEAAIAGESEATRLARNAKRDMGGAWYRKKILDQFLPPEVIQSFILKRLKSDAELKLGAFTKAVITVPAYFNEPRRKATQDAGELAGIDVVDIINEPTAAALAYGIQRGFLNEKGESANREMILVYDLGGGTFDATLMKIDNAKFTAVATAGDVYLGGIDWDHRVFDFARKEFESKYDVNFDSDPSLNEKLMNQCVRAKISLTARSQTVIRLEYEGERFKVEIDRSQFEDLTTDLLERTKLTTERLLRDAKLDWPDITKLLLVGGSTRMPMVSRMLEEISGQTVDRSLSPDECVAHGAAIYAGILLKHGSSASEGISIQNVNSHDLGVLGVDPKTGQKRRKVVIPRNRALPTKTSKRFQTSKESQTKIVVQVVEGGTATGQGSTMIGKCVVTDLPPNIKKGTTVVVTFNYLSSGRLDVVAEIPELNISADSAISRAQGMTRSDIVKWKNRLAAGIEVDELFPKKLPKQQKPATSSSTSAKKASRVQAPKIVTPTKRKRPVEQAFNINVVGKKSKPAIVIDADDEMFAFEDSPKKDDAGDSALDFLEKDDKSSGANGSSLDEFLTELD